MIWTDAEDQVIRDNYSTASSAKIADMIGHGLTRNAVIGRSHRLGLSLAKPKAPPRVKVARIKHPPAVREYVSPPIPVVPLNIPFLDLQPKHCREIVGKDGWMSLSCGHPVINESSYCRWHHSINHMAALPRKVSAMRFAA